MVSFFYDMASFVLISLMLLVDLSRLKSQWLTNTRNTTSRPSSGTGMCYWLRYSAPSCGGFRRFFFACDFANVGQKNPMRPPVCTQVFSLLLWMCAGSSSPSATTLWSWTPQTCTGTLIWTASCRRRQKSRLISLPCCCSSIAPDTFARRLHSLSEGLWSFASISFQ